MSQPAATPPRYDFRRPDRIPKERVRSLQFLYDRFARNLGTSLSAYLRVATEVELTAVEQSPYGEFVASLPEQTAFYMLDLKPATGRAGLEVSPAAAYAMIDRMLGGRGEPSVVERALTDIEQRVVDNVVRLILEQMTDEWRQVGKIEFSILRRETRPQMLQITAANDAVVTLCLRVKLGSTEGTLKFCLPAAVLEELDPGFLDRRRHVNGSRRSDADVAQLKDNLSRVPLDVEAVLATPLPVADLVALQVEDVIALGRPVRVPVDLLVCGTRKFSGTLTLTEEGTGVTIQTAMPTRLAETGG